MAAIRPRVSASGKLICMPEIVGRAALAGAIRSPRRYGAQQGLGLVKEGVDALGERAVNAFNLREFIHPGILHHAQPAKG